jgi:very-short-patch-repair endonuclease
LKIYNKPELKERRRELRKNQTNEEKLLWQHLRKKQLNGIKFYRQYSIDYYIADFYAPKLKLAIELDGAHHFTDSGKEYDEIRAEIINNYQIEILRFPNREILHDIDKVIERIKEKAVIV